MRATVHHYLMQRPSGATAGELLDLVFTKPGADPEFGPRFLHALLDGDPRFFYRAAEQRWVAAAQAALAVPLSQTEFVVVDLETTGGSPERGDAIIEVGAVRIDRDRCTRRFQSFVNPGRRLPRFITRLTGITDDMLAQQPSIAEVLPVFLEFVGDRVLVAHNAGFDVGFLDAAAGAHIGRPLHQAHLCTMRLARRLLPRLRRRGLDTVAAHFGIALVDRHRALGDATITAEIFFHLLELLSARGIDRLDQALALQASARDGRVFFCPMPRADVERLPQRPGIYRFFGAAAADGRAGPLLYIGKAKNLRERVGHYLSNAGGHSNKTLDLIRHIHAVRCVDAGSELEAALMEAEAIRAEKPPYNRLLKHLPRIAFLKLSMDAEFPRLSIARRPSRRADRCFGPFRSRASAERALALLTRLFQLRTCAGRLHPRADATPCFQGQIGACTAPCAARIDAPGYRAHVAAFLRLMAGDAEALAAAHDELHRRLRGHSEGLRFEAAAHTQRHLDQLERLLRRQRGLGAFGWTAQHNFLVMQPSVVPGAAVAYLVVAGRLAERRRVSDPVELSSLAARAQQLVGRSSSPPSAADVDGTAILAAWLRDRGERDGFVFQLEKTGAASLAPQLGEWEAALASILTRAPVSPGGYARAGPSAADP